jgi:two-component system LytT family sensor kinase
LNFFTKNIRWALPVCFVLASCLLAVILHYLSPLSNYQVWKESNLFWLVPGLIATISVRLIETYPTKAGVIFYAVCIGVSAGFIAWYTDIYLLRLWSATDAAHLTFINRTFFDRLVIALALTLPVTIITAVHKQLQEVRARLGRHSSVEGLLKEAELFKLRQQLQPHFLYNSLNSINSLILIDTDKAQEMVGRLSDFLRASVKKDTNEALPIADELTYLEAYLAIESVRFGDRLSITYVHDYTGDARMPPFLLQPVIENAIKFGLYGSTGKVTIAVHIALIADVLEISIANPYDPLMQPQKGTGFGLAGIQRRLYLLYGREDLLQIKQENNYFTTTLKIPQLHVQSSAD